jgi:hypothetical protein
MAAKCASMNNKIFIIVINCPFGAKGQLPGCRTKIKSATAAVADF